VSDAGSLRVTVYVVDAETGRRTLLRDQVLVTDGPLQSQQYPPCECPRCSQPTSTAVVA